MHKFTCVFTAEPQLEEEFRTLFNQMGVRQARAPSLAPS